MLDLNSLAGPLIVGLAFGGGLVPSLASANKAAFSELARGKRVPSSSGSSEPMGPILSCSPILGYPSPLYLADVADVTSRLSSSKLPSAPGQYLQRDEFERIVPALPSKPASMRGLDGNVLLVSPQPTSSQAPTPVAVDAAWTALSAGSSIVSAEEIGRQLSRWRPEPDVLVLDEFEKSLMQGRLQVLIGYVTLFGLQGLVLGLFVVQPLSELLQS
jgi:hypothetical protein